MVAALREQDTSRFVRLLISQDEIDALGLGRDKSERLLAKSNRAARDFKVLAERQKSVGQNARWVQFAASSPGTVPSGTDGSTKDVVVYENAVAMFEQEDQGGQAETLREPADGGALEPSPGELRKLLLALGLANEPWLIVMDEPTNHLDLPSIECLEDALAECPCGQLLVSHDERFLGRLTNRTWRITDGWLVEES